MMLKATKLCAIFPLFLTGAVVRAAVRPRSMTMPVPPLSTVAMETLPPVDEARLRAEDAANARKDIPTRVGEARPAHFDPARHGTWEALSDGGWLWRLQLRVPGVTWLNLGFDPYELPAGAELFVFDPDGMHIFGPYTAADNRDYRQLATPAVPGEITVIEVYLPAFTVRAGLSLAVGTVVAGYKNFINPGPDASGACEVDINCATGNNWQSDKRAVARLLFNGYLCTGTLVNDVPGDCKNYFLTANHCINKARDATNCIFYWNYENSSCGGGSSSLSQNQTGSVIRATSSNSDFTLLELSAAPTAAFNVYYAGWTNTATAATSATGIHHPAGDVKKISVENNALVDGQASGWGPTHWRVPQWDTGVTEGGSSGSGLWNPNHQIVGQLHGGASLCGNAPGSMWDEYGKFSVSWSAGGTAATQLRDWLDPAATGAVSVAGKNNTTCVSCSAPTGVNAPTVADVSACAATGITVTWFAPAAWGDSSGTRTWTVLRGGVAVASGPCAGAIAGTTLTCTDTSTIAGTAYAYSVRANNGCGMSTPSAASASVTDNTDATAPASPTQSIAKVSPNINFTWPSVPGAAAYLTYSAATPNPATWTLRNTTATLAWSNTADLGAAGRFFYTTTARDACLNESPK